MSPLKRAYSIALILGQFLVLSVCMFVFESVSKILARCRRAKNSKAAKSSGKDNGTTKERPTKVGR
jgi:hypothetical protein